VIEQVGLQRESALIGAAGEHYILYRLLREGFLAAPAPPGAAIADLLVFNPTTMSVGAMIQVKTRNPGGRIRAWRMRDKNAEFEHPRLFYVLVDLTDEPPTVFIVPSHDVKETLSRDHTAFLARGGKDSAVRRFAPEPRWLDGQHERWDLLNG